MSTRKGSGYYAVGVLLVILAMVLTSVAALAEVPGGQADIDHDKGVWEDTFDDSKDVSACEDLVFNKGYYTTKRENVSHEWKGSALKGTDGGGGLDMIYGNEKLTSSHSVTEKSGTFPWDKSHQWYTMNPGQSGTISWLSNKWAEGRGQDGYIYGEHYEAGKSDGYLRLAHAASGQDWNPAYQVKRFPYVRVISAHRPNYSSGGMEVVVNYTALHEWAANTGVTFRDKNGLPVGKVDQGGKSTGKKLKFYKADNSVAWQGGYDNTEWHTFTVEWDSSKFYYFVDGAYKGSCATTGRGAAVEILAGNTTPAQTPCFWAGFAIHRWRHWDNNGAYTLSEWDTENKGTIIDEGSITTEYTGSAQGAAITKQYKLDGSASNLPASGRKVAPHITYRIPRRSGEITVKKATVNGKKNVRGTLTSKAIGPNPVGIKSWGKIKLDLNLPESTDCKISVLNAADGSVLLTDLSDGDSLAKIDKNAVPEIKLRAELWSSHGENKPKLNSWGVTWDSVEGTQAVDPGSSDFDMYISMQNPNNKEVRAALLLYNHSGEVKKVFKDLPANSRGTVHVNNYAPQQEVSVKVVASDPIICERPMYFRYNNNGATGGHDSMGAKSLSKTWHFAEGYTGGEFDTYYLVMNPSSRPVYVHAIFMTNGGENIEDMYEVAPNSRFTISADAIYGLESAEVSASFDVDEPVMMERAMYFRYDGGRDGGHNKPGVTATSNSWYFAEGYTGGDFDTYVLIQNPQSSPANVEVRLIREDKSLEIIDVTVPARTRQTVRCDDVLPNSKFGVAVESNQKIIAERSIYFNDNGRMGGSDSTGSTKLAKTWYLAEGYTVDPFDTQLAIVNPGREDADVTVTFMLPGGKTAKKEMKIWRERRASFVVDAEPGLASTEVSFKVESSTPVMVERSMYFDSDGRKGGHVETGTTSASEVWYFAEGYTK